MISATRANGFSSLIASSVSGLNKSLQQMDEASEKIAQGGDMVESYSDQVQAGIMFKANAAVIRNATDTVGTLLDEKA